MLSCNSSSIWSKPEACLTVTCKVMTTTMRKINQMNVIHAREWQAIKQALSEKPDVLLSLYGDTSLAGQNFYTTVRDSVLNQGEIESQPLPMLE